MADTEDEIHFFLSCTSYAALRQDLLAQLRHLLPQYANLIDHPETRRNQKTLLKILVKGIGKKDTDFEIFDLIATYITNTKRFEW